MGGWGELKGETNAPDSGQTGTRKRLALHHTVPESQKHQRGYHTLTGRQQLNQSAYHPSWTWLPPLLPALSRGTCSRSCVCDRVRRGVTGGGGPQTSSTSELLITPGAGIHPLAGLTTAVQLNDRQGMHNMCATGWCYYSPVKNRPRLQRPSPVIALQETSSVPQPVYSGDSSNFTRKPLGLEQPHHVVIIG